MKIALIGFGKMGKAIQSLALDHGHEVWICRTTDQLKELSQVCPNVAIEFTSPESAFKNVMACIDAGIPVVCGTTGWQEQRPQTEEYCLKKQGTFFYASNFSLGVNIFFRLNRYLADLMSKYPQYKAAINEIHHTQKKDSPSGTAIVLAEEILKFNPSKTGWSVGEMEEDKLPILSERKDPYPGTHTVTWKSPIDQISIRHHANNREGFASGALAVAEWLPTQKGVLTMNDFLGF